MSRFAFALDVVREHSDDVLFLGDASASDWARIFSAAEPRTFIEGEQLVEEGEADRALYFLTEGSVRLMGVGLFKTIDAPSVLGEIAFLDGERRSVGLWGAGDGQIVRFDRDAYEALSAEDSELGRRIALDLGSVAALRLRMAQQRAILERMTIEAPASPVTLRPIEHSDRDEFLAMVRASRDLHRPWAYPPERPDQFDELVARAGRDDVVTLLACRAGGGEIVGVFTISQIVRGAFQSAFLGYYGSAAHARRGYMRAGMRLVLDHAFGPLRLHRLEANIQPGNAPSIALARGGGFRLEGFSPRYLLIGGRWRDHERWAITSEEWRERT